MSQLIDLNIADEALVERLAAITFKAFQKPAPGWLPDIDAARRQVVDAGSAGRLGRVLVDDGVPQGWIGIIRRRYLWEIHPIAVAKDAQGKGTGTALVEDAAQLAKKAGALTLYASTSDETGATNLSGADLYDNPSSAIANIQAHARTPYRFWQNVGFTVVGLLPDAEGAGKPAIHLARRV